MKDLIIQALNEAIEILNKRTPQTKKDRKSIDITDVNPFELSSFMKDNNIPKDAYFDGKDNGYDGWVCGKTLLSWDIDVPTTDKDKLIFNRRVFIQIAFKAVYDTLTANGFKRIGYDTSLLKEFKDTTVYDMFINCEYDRLVKYYSLSFIPSV